MKNANLEIEKFWRIYQPIDELIENTPYYIEIKYDSKTNMILKPNRLKENLTIKFNEDQVLPSIIKLNVYRRIRGIHIPNSHIGCININNIPADTTKIDLKCNIIGRDLFITVNITCKDKTKNSTLKGDMYINEIYKARDEFLDYITDSIFICNTAKELVMACRNTNNCGIKFNQNLELECYNSRITFLKNLYISSLISCSDDIDDISQKLDKFIEELNCILNNVDFCSIFIKRYIEEQYNPKHKPINLCDGEVLDKICNYIYDNSNNKEIAKKYMYIIAILFKNMKSTNCDTRKSISNILDKQIDFMLSNSKFNVGYITSLYYNVYDNDEINKDSIFFKSIEYVYNYALINRTKIYGYANLSHKLIEHCISITNNKYLSDLNF